MDSKIILSHIFDGIVALGILTFIVFLVMKMTRKRMGIAEALTDNPKGTLEMITAMSTVLEIISLTIMGIERGIPISSGFSRYGVAGIFEILFSFLFSMTSAKCFADGRVTKNEVFELFTYFFLSVLSTVLIFILYLESIGRVSFIMNGLFDPNYKITKGTIELGALVTIFCTIPLNLINSLFQYKEMVKNNVVTPVSPPSTSTNNTVTTTPSATPVATTPTSATLASTASNSATSGGAVA